LTDFFVKSLYMSVLPSYFKVPAIAMLICLASGSLMAQQADSVPPKKHGYIASYWHNGLGLVASPLHWRGDEWAKVGGTLVITGVVISMDEPISQPFFDWQTDFADAFGKTGKFLGSPPFQAAFSGAALGIGAIAHNKPLQNFALDNLQAQIFTGGLTFLVKELAHRARPYTGEGAYVWHGPFGEGGNDYQSFFSGHSSLAFSTATMVFLHCKKKWWVGLISYATATGVAISRMQTHDHWASDIVLGAAIGSAVSTFVYNQQEKRRNPTKKLKDLP
jgi:membrane-associated phospholipid phosphatase